VCAIDRLEARRGIAAPLARASRPLPGLPDEEDLVLSLAYFEGLAPWRIAARLGIPEEAVRARLRAALVRLRPPRSPRG
jgi:DNA-directed RNA polymerase specialized sigma24 family protein